MHPFLYLEPLATTRGSQHRNKIGIIFQMCVPIFVKLSNRSGYHFKNGFFALGVLETEKTDSKTLF